MRSLHHLIAAWGVGGNSFENTVCLRHKLLYSVKELLGEVHPMRPVNMSVLVDDCQGLLSSTRKINAAYILEPL